MGRPHLPGIIHLMTPEEIPLRTEMLRGREATLRTEWWTAHKKAEELLKELNVAILERSVWEERVRHEEIRVERLKAKS